MKNFNQYKYKFYFILHELFFHLYKKNKRSTIQIDQSVQIQRSQFFASIFQLLQQSYFKLALLVTVRSLEASIA